MGITSLQSLQPLYTQTQTVELWKNPNALDACIAEHLWSDVNVVCVFQHLTRKHSYVGLARLKWTSGLTQQLLTDLLQRTQLTTNHHNNRVSIKTSVHEMALTDKQLKSVHSLCSFGRRGSARWFHTQTKSHRYEAQELWCNYNIHPESRQKMI